MQILIQIQFNQQVNEEKRILEVCALVLLDISNSLLENL